MRGIGTLHPSENIPVPPDSVVTLLIAASSGQYSDFPANTQMVRFTGLSTAGAQLNFHVCIGSTKAAVPSAATSTFGTTGFTYPIVGQGAFQNAGGSTGFSVAGLAPGYVIAECWKKGG